MAQTQGHYSPASLTTEGFIHCSAATQLVEVANRFYRGQIDLVILGIMPDRLQADLRYDLVPGHGTFPHLYGPLNLAAVSKVWPWETAADGTFCLPEEISRAEHH